MHDSGESHRETGRSAEQIMRIRKADREGHRLAEDSCESYKQGIRLAMIWHSVKKRTTRTVVRFFLLIL